MSTFDPVKILRKLTPERDGEPVLTRRKGVITAVSAAGTIDVSLSGVTVEDVPIIGSPSEYVVGHSVHLLAGRGELLALGMAAAGTGTAKPLAHILWGTPNMVHNSLTTLTPNTVPVNDGGMWTSGTDFTIPADEGGLYEMGLALQYASQATAAGQRQARFRVNGADFTYNPVTAVGLNGTLTGGFAVARKELTAGDVVTFLGFQNSGVDLALNASSHGWLERMR